MPVLSPRSRAAAAAAFLLLAATAVRGARTPADALPRPLLERLRGVVVRDLESRLVRPVHRGLLRADALRLLRQLDDEQLAALATGSSLEDVVAMADAATPEATRLAAASGLRLATGAALGDAESDLLFVPVAPCRILDTRLVGGPLQAGTVYGFQVAGTDGFAEQGGAAGGCGIPVGATTPLAPSVVVNFVAVGPEGPGHLSAWEFGEPRANHSILNYSNLPGLNIANGVVVPISGVGTTEADLHVVAVVNRAHVVADVTGYFTRFPIEQFQGSLRSVMQQSVASTLTSLASGACAELNSCTVTAAAAGAVIVEAWGQAVTDHVGGTDDRLEMAFESASPVACDQTGVDVAAYEVSAALGSSPDVDFVVSLARQYPQASGVTTTYRLVGRMAAGASTGDAIENTRMICTFIPD